MKKITALLLTAVLLCSAFTALTYEEEITFQGIPWGSSSEDVLRVMINRLLQHESLASDIEALGVKEAAGKLLTTTILRGAKVIQRL